MLVALSDTHSRSDPRLPPHLRQQVREATVTLHAGDFTTRQVLESFVELTDLVAVAGNRDRPPVRNRLGTTSTVEQFGRRFLLVHGHEHDETSLSLLARQEDADIVVTGHTHRPTLRTLGERMLVNPGSYADPRGNRPAYATVEDTNKGVAVTLRNIDGKAFQEATV